jgi:hypothetical protein
MSIVNRDGPGDSQRRPSADRNSLADTLILTDGLEGAVLGGMTRPELASCSVVSVVAPSLLKVVTRRHSPNKREHSMKVSPFHSSNPSDPDVHHDHSDCPTGQQIPERNKVSGTGGFPRCKQCIAKG